MGSRKLPSRSGRGGGGAGAGAGASQRGEVQNLARQGSLYSLTLDEVQNHLGEPLQSMNLDELLRSVFPDDMEPDAATTSQYEPSSSLLRQGSITMPNGLSKKTVDEVWRGIQDEPKRSVPEGGRRKRERQPTLGEMTLEDFLVKAGVVTEGCLKNSTLLGGGRRGAKNQTDSLRLRASSSLESGSPAWPRPPRPSASTAQQRPSSISMGETMSEVITKFAVTSMFMWMAPVAIIYAFYHQIFPGLSQLSSSVQTLASGFLAVISVNIVIGFYIYSAMKETPHQEPQPDATFLANAKASINQPTSSQVCDDSQGKGKVE